MGKDETTNKSARANEGEYRILLIVFAFAAEIPLREAFTLIERKTAVFLRTQRRKGTNYFDSS